MSHYSSDLHIFLWFIIVECIIIFYLFHSIQKVPEPRTHVSYSYDIFSEKRAWNFLTKLHGLGPRLLGSPSNEIHSPALLLSGIIQAGTTNQQEWKFVSGLGSAYWMYSRNNKHDITQKTERGCYCPKINYPYHTIDDRLNRVLQICLPGDHLKHTPKWYTTVQNILQISYVSGCQSLNEWIQVDIFLQYITHTFQLQVIPKLEDIPIPEPILRQMKELLAASIATEHLFSLFMKPYYCVSKEAIQDCQNMKSILPIQRLLLLPSKEPNNKALVMDISLSSDYSGQFILDIANGGILNNVYQNMTNLGLRLIPWKLLFSPDCPTTVQSTLLNQYRTVFKTLNTIYQEKQLHATQYLNELEMEQTINTINRYLTITLNNYTNNDLTLPTVLLGAHFDTAVSSPGAADDGAPVAITLEVLTNMLSHHFKTPCIERPLLILLNGINRHQMIVHKYLIELLLGGEENVLPAAHGFIQYHPWAMSAVDALNLEAAGNWGSEYLLRTGSRSRDLLQIYRQVVKHPNAVAGSQDAFELGLIPGLTDFEIFRDIGKMEGFDFALGSGGYYYHTALDSLETLQKGSIQHYGETISALTLAFLNRSVIEESNGLHYITFDTIQKQRQLINQQYDTFLVLFKYYFIIIPSHWIHSYWLFGISIFFYIALSLLPDAIDLCVFTTIHKKANLTLSSTDDYDNTTTDCRQTLNSNKHPTVVHGFFSFKERITMIILWGFTGCLWYIFFLMTSVICNALFGYLLELCGFGMRWFTNPILATILYSVIPIILSTECLSTQRRTQCYKHNDTKLSIRCLEIQIFLGVYIFWTFLILIGIITHSRITIVPVVLLFTTLIGRLVGIAIPTFFSYQHYGHRFGMMIGNIIAIILIGQNYTALIDHMIPVFGRTVIPESPEIILSFMTTLFICVLSPFIVMTSQTSLCFNNHQLSQIRKFEWFFLCPLVLSFVFLHPVFTELIPQRLDIVHFTTRRYAGYMNDQRVTLMREESGMTLQTMDRIGISSTLLSRFAENVQTVKQLNTTNFIPSSPTSFYDIMLTDNLTASSIPTTLHKWFSVPSIPEHSFYRYPQGGAFRRFASPFIHVFPDLVPPLNVPREDHLKPLSDKRWFFEDELNVFSSSKPIPYSSRHSPPKLTWKIEKINEFLRRVFITIEGSQRMIVSIPSKQPVIGWSFSKTLPIPRMECDCYGTIFGAGTSVPKGYSFTVDYDLRQSSLKYRNSHHLFSLSISANYFDIDTPILQQMLQLEKELKKEGIFFTTIRSVGEVGFWEIEIE